MKILLITPTGAHKEFLSTPDGKVGKLKSANKKHDRRFFC